MSRSELKTYILETYSVVSDFPWAKDPNSEVFRHMDSKKWFALIMDVSKIKLGLKTDELIEVVNFKCDPVLIGNLRSEQGIFPAYHMNKNNWITVSLDGSVSDDRIKMLLDMSFELTDIKKCNHWIWRVRP